MNEKKEATTTRKAGRCCVNVEATLEKGSEARTKSFL